VAVEALTGRLAVGARHGVTESGKHGAGRRPFAATEPGGVVLSLLVVLILLYTGWRGWEMVYKHRVAVSDQP
jgi:Predicted membrane protein (DUF2231)